MWKRNLILLITVFMLNFMFNISMLSFLEGGPYFAEALTIILFLCFAMLCIITAYRKKRYAWKTNAGFFSLNMLHVMNLYMSQQYKSFILALGFVNLIGLYVSLGFVRSLCRHSPKRKTNRKV